MQASDQQQLVDALIPLSRAAGRLIMDIYHSDFAVRGKADASPVTEAYNTGAAFSFLADASGGQRWLFAVIAVVVSVVLCVWLARLDRSKKLEAIALALILGGAIGNLYDRVIHGKVTDFILVHWQQSWFFPAFNIADSAITVGAALLLFDMFFGRKPEQN